MIGNYKQSEICRKYNGNFDNFWEVLKKFQEKFIEILYI